MNVLRHAARRADQRVYASSLRSRWYSTLPRVCSSCSAPLLSALPTCTNCSHIEPIPDTTTYFDILGLASSRNKYKLDTKDLRMRFLQAQRVCHPDAWSGKGQVRHAIPYACQRQLINFKERARNGCSSVIYLELSLQNSLLPGPPCPIHSRAGGISTFGDRQTH